MESKKAPVAWKKVCVLKAQGGLGLYRLVVWNLVFQAKKIWRLAMDKESLWMKWVRTFHIKGMDLWSMAKPHEFSSAVNALFKYRPLLQEIFTLRQLEFQTCFSMKAVYLDVMENFDPVRWRKLAWGPRHVPKTSIIFWLCALDALNTSEKVMTWRIGSICFSSVDLLDRCC